jgi:restriction-modification enzyme MmeI-like protein
MNAVEIEEAVSALVEAPFDPEEFPYAFLAAFGNKETTIKRLRQGSTNKSDVPGAVLQRSNIHLTVCEPGTVGDTLKQLVNSPATAKQKAKFALATDGQTIEAENLVDGDTLACAFPELADHFGFLLPLAGITTVQQIRENAFDIQATGRLNRLYVELLRNNPDWDAADRREALNHFFARLIFCFFAEDTGIFIGTNLFTATIQQMSAPDGSDTAFVLSELFRAMDTAHAERPNAKLRSWADSFPYVNGGLFSGAGGDNDVPEFTKAARSYLLHIGRLDWTKINPDIFGSMIQAVADDEERGALGMHYTSVPNILKVLNPLFLDDLREKLDEAGDNARKLLNLRKRLARIRVFDPACGSGNFLVIAYKEMRKIEAEINRRRRETDRRTEIPLTNLRGIELRHFACEISRLALVIAEFQCDALHRGESLARAEFLPLDSQNWITHGNALRLDWLSICPPTGTGVKLHSDDLFETPLDQTEMDFENEGGEIYICGNPPYLGSQGQTDTHKSDLKDIFSDRTRTWRSLDYVAGWFMKAADYGTKTSSTTALVSTNSICQGKQVPILWPLIFRTGHHIEFAHTSFKWSNLASHNAGVTVVIVGISLKPDRVRTIFSEDQGRHNARQCTNINAYLVPGENVEVQKSSRPLSALPAMTFGNQPIDGGCLTVTPEERSLISTAGDRHDRFVRRYLGSREFINGISRWCLWIEDDDLDAARANTVISEKLNGVAKFRAESIRAETNKLASTPHQFAYKPHRDCTTTIIVPSASSETRPFLPCGLLPIGTVVSNLAFALYDAPLWNMALIASRIHLVWIATVCGKLETRYRYSNTLGWNTFPVPPLSDQNKADLTRCAEDILLAREAHWPATIADMYNPDRMDTEFPDLRAAHDRNDETLERIYIGRRFKNDTERLETLFEMYTAMTAKEKPGKGAKSGTAKKGTSKGGKQ